MPRGDKLFKFLASLMMRGFYGTVTIRFECGKVTHVQTETRRQWRYDDLPEQQLDLLGSKNGGGIPPGFRSERDV